MRIRKFAAVCLVLLGLVLAACGSTTTSTTTSSSNTPTTALGNNLVKSISALTQTGDFNTPLDSTPDMDAANIYFTASGPHGPGVFRVPSAGGAVTEVYTGSPFVAPRGIAFSSDGQHLYVADPGAGAGGQIFQLAPSGGAPTPVRGSIGTAPQNLEVVLQGGQQVIYFTGRDSSSGQAAVFKLAAVGASAATVLAKGSPLVAPDGVAVTQSGIVYISDRLASGGDIGKVFKIDGSAVSVLIDQVRTGNPAGIALTQDQSLLLVSALQLQSPTDQVLVLNLQTNQTGSITTVVSENHSAGGLHSCPCAQQQSSAAWHTSAALAQSVLIGPRLATTQHFSWADRTGGGKGRGEVYIVTV